MNPRISVIIPTFNRYQLLNEAVEQFFYQSLPKEEFELIVVDDGSNDETWKIATRDLPFKLSYYRQANQGDASARNVGVSMSEADLLVFIDDDIMISTAYLQELIEVSGNHSRQIVLGTTVPRDLCGDYLSSEENKTLPLTDMLYEEVPFTELRSNNMAIRRVDYKSIGPMDSLGFSGSSIWCDVDFAYRAFKLGYRFIRAPKAMCCDRDYAMRDTGDRFLRGKASAFRAVALFQKFPGIQPYLPMFRDMTPIDWRKDSPDLVLRKLARHPASSKPMVRAMEWSMKMLEKSFPSSTMMRVLQRWIHGAYVFQGYREGLSEFDLDKVGTVT